MPAAFTAAERTRITAQLRRSGRRLFTTQGLRKTSIDELVAPAGIVKSTFYVFFDSKEALYLELILEGTAAVRQRTVDDGLRHGTDTRDALRRFLRGAVEVITSDPLYRRLTTHPEELAAVLAKLDPSAIERAGDNGMAELTEFVAEAQRSGDMLGDSPDVVVGVMRAVLLLTRHTEEFGESYPLVLDLLIDSVTTGLTTARQPRRPSTSTVRKTPKTPSTSRTGKTERKR
ncbi:TetR/AcrR family transcriptional regulator [Actinopolymorpha pittospori]